MGASQSREILPPGPPYPGPAAEYSFIETQVTMTGKVSFAQSNQMITTNIDSYYPILGQKYAEGFRLLSFYRIPFAALQQHPFSLKMDVPYQGIFIRHPTVPRLEAWHLHVVKAVMVVQVVRHGLISAEVATDTSQINQAIVENTSTGGRLICVETTGLQKRQGFRAEMRGQGPIMGVDLFFEMPSVPTAERYVYMCVPCPVQLKAGPSFGGTGLTVKCDWLGIMKQYLSKGWRLVEVFFDDGFKHQGLSRKMDLNSIWFFEKPMSRMNDDTEVYEAVVIEHYIELRTVCCGGVRTIPKWEPVIERFGREGWELACIVETMEGAQTGCTTAEIKVFLFFQRPILRAEGRWETQGFVSGKDPIEFQSPPPYDG
ncbi:uncharacterized protein LOC124267741 [Haliotis rubra]|uniref:uncharacterized protein LOC124267741 n=1 Tax=Haliotis rubra TaxID=36100 RepID=UPI001EE54E5B|nr:uncharacterized protein LOC124267741 [Haliotis rubra]XP_046558687.1 uncharacterized protein LOC124267741 [Haliotis rubra]